MTESCCIFSLWTMFSLIDCKTQLYGSKKLYKMTGNGEKKCRKKLDYKTPSSSTSPYIMIEMLQMTIMIKF